jgi:hypothetical protein
MRWAFGTSTKPGVPIDQSLRSTWENLKRAQGLSPGEVTESHVAQAIVGAAALIGTGLFGSRHSVGLSGTSVEPTDAVGAPPELHQIMVSIAQLPDLPAAAPAQASAAPAAPTPG